MPSGLAADLGPRRRRQPGRSILGLFRIHLFPPEFPACSIRGGDRWCRGRARTRAGTRAASFPRADGAVLCSSSPKSSPDAIRAGPSPQKKPRTEPCGDGFVTERLLGTSGTWQRPNSPHKGQGRGPAPAPLHSAFSCEICSKILFFLLFFFFSRQRATGRRWHTRALPAPRGNFTARRGSGPSSLTSRCQWCPGEAPKRSKTTQKKQSCSPPAPAFVRGGRRALLRAGVWFYFQPFQASRSCCSHQIGDFPSHTNRPGRAAAKRKGRRTAPPKKKPHRGGESSTGTLDPLPASIRLKPTQRFIVRWRITRRGKSPSLPSGNLWLASN